MTKHRENHGTKAEDRVEKILRSTYLEDFVVRNPKGLKENGRETEIADFLIPFRDVLIAIQVKSRERCLAEEEPSDVELARFQGRLMEGVKQLKNCKRALDNKWATEIQTLRGTKQPFCYDRFKSIIGIAVLDTPTSDGTEMETALDLYGGLDEVQGVVAHLFMRKDFEVLVEQLSTIPDLVEYLKVREKLKKTGILDPLSNELDLLAVFICQYGVVEKFHRGEITHLVLLSGMWEDFQQQRAEDFEKRSADIRESKHFFDEMMEKMHGCIGFEVPAWAMPPGLSSGPGTAEQHLRIVEQLAGLQRVDRIRFTEKMKIKMAKADEVGFGWFVDIPGERSCPILFLSCNWDRQKRNSVLESLVCALSVRCKGRLVMGVATEQMSSILRSYDTVVVEEGAEFDNQDELAEAALQCFGPEQEGSRDEWGNDYPPETS